LKKRCLDHDVKFYNFINNRCSEEVNLL